MMYRDVRIQGRAGCGMGPRVMYRDVRIQGRAAVYDRVFIARFDPVVGIVLESQGKSAMVNGAAVIMARQH